MKQFPMAPGNGEPSLVQREKDVGTPLSCCASLHIQLCVRVVGRILMEHWWLCSVCVCVYARARVSQLLQGSFCPGDRAAAIRVSKYT